LLSRRWVLFLLAVIALALLAYRLGQWQFDRLDERLARNEVARANLGAVPVPVDEVLAVGEPVAAGEEWRRVTATGTYVADETVVIRYQTRDGASGVDVVTPLRTSDGPAVLVSRGWVPTDNTGDLDADVPAPPSGEVTVVGWVRADGTGDATTVVDQSARAVSSEQIAPMLPFPVYGGFVDARSESPAPTTPVLRAEPPDLSEGPHFFYGLQWWFFAALAVFGFGYLAWDERRKLVARRRDPGVDAPREPERERTGV